MTASGGGGYCLPGRRGTGCPAAPPHARSPSPTDDDTISILGRICDRRESPQVGVEGVDVTVEDEAGAVIGEATSGADGTFVVDLPGDAVSLLGKSFTVTLDEESLPEDTEPEVLTRTVPINLDNDQSVTFPIGDAPVAAGAGFAVEALQLTVGGLVFSALLAMAALGLSMIFGTTGLTNFAHGELITFGAIMAFAFDQLPGEVTIGGVNITVVVGVVFAFVMSGCLRLAQRRRPVAAAAPPRHGHHRDDDREHRSLDLPAQPLPVLRRRAEPQLLPVLRGHAAGRSARC